MTGLKLGPEKEYLEAGSGSGDQNTSDQAETWTTVSLTSSLHTSHSTPAQNKKGKLFILNLTSSYLWFLDSIYLFKFWLNIYFAKFKSVDLFEVELTECSQKWLWIICKPLLLLIEIVNQDNGSEWSHVWHNDLFIWL